MLVSVVQIGNSRGVRLPKAILDQLEISDQVEMEVENRQIILTPVPRQARQGWDAAFQRMHEAEDDLLVAEGSAPEGFEWEW